MARWHKGVDWGYGKPATVVTTVDSTTGERVQLDQEQLDVLIARHEDEHIKREYERLARHLRATMMIDYRAATASPNTRAHWLREQRRVAIRIYQHAK